MDLNRTTKILCVILGICAFFAVFSWASNMDYEETVLYNMPQEAFEQICLDIGDGCSDSQIVDTYISNKDFYDSLSNY